MVVTPMKIIGICVCTLTSCRGAQGKKIDYNKRLLLFLPWATHSISRPDKPLISTSCSCLWLRPSSILPIGSTALRLHTLIFIGSISN